MNACPCKDCVPPKRHPACWGSCPDFETFNEERLLKKSEIRKAKNQEDMVVTYVISQKNKYPHRKQRQYANKGGD